MRFDLVEPFIVILANWRLKEVCRVRIDVLFGVDAVCLRRLRLW